MTPPWPVDGSRRRSDSVTPGKRTPPTLADADESHVGDHIHARVGQHGRRRRGGGGARAEG
jgi:hypothetical protein